VCALLAEQSEQWTERRYLDMDEFHEWWIISVLSH
jgi:hypothetical protein